MKKLLLPIAGSPNDRHAVQAVIRRFLNETALEVHLLNVQRPFSWHVSRHAPAGQRKAHHDEQAAQALAPAREQLDRYGVPYAVHTVVGQPAESITDAAHRLGCDRIVMATARKNTLTRWVENSVTERVVELTDVPVELIAGDSMSRWERYGIPAAIGALLAMALEMVAR